MSEIIKFLEENRVGFMATIDGNKPRVRAFGYLYSEDDNLYFCTANTKNVYRQMQENSTVEFAAMSKSFDTLRVSGDIHFTDDREKKVKVFEAAPQLKALYQDAHNPVFEVFYMSVKEAIFFNMANPQPRVVEF
ncbi:MAG: pyridoxamine 5'-phosphate oxidase family protein [bacterium]|nr:pyridoxamine 5'-phosphate oxidase family protein [bacterium]